MFKVKYVDSIMMLVRLDLNLIVSLFQHTCTCKCEVSETVSTTTLIHVHTVQEERNELVSNMFLLRSYSMFFAYICFHLFSLAHRTTQTPSSYMYIVSPAAKTTSLGLAD